MLRTAHVLKVAALAAMLCVGSAHAAGKYVLISHAPDSDSWWNTIKNAVKQAGEDYGVQVDYRNPPNGDLADMARLIEQAAAQGYDGVITTIADYNVLQGAIKKVTDKKIPVITINSGTTEQSEKLGAVMHVGQPEYAAGKGAGERAKAAGIKSFLCVNHYATNPASFDRCRGFADAIGADAKKSTEVLICLSCESRAEVDELVAKAVKAGGSTPSDKQDHGFMYSHSFEDLDGHIWELVHMSGTPPKE